MAARAPARAGAASRRLVAWARGARRAALALRCWAALRPAAPVLAAEEAAYLQYMYLKCELQPIDTEPAFNPMVVKYEATMDWKMETFSVQANPVPPAVIENVHVCRHDADCAKEDQTMVVVDFSTNIFVPPGEKVRFRFDVIRHGEVKSYTLIVRRLKGSETTLRGIVAQGLTIWPAVSGAGSTEAGFSKNITHYRCLMDVSFEIALLELVLEDAGQTIVASADPPVLLGKGNNFSLLKNTHPGLLHAPPVRRRLGGQGAASRLSWAPAPSDELPAAALPLLAGLGAPPPGAPPVRGAAPFPGAPPPRGPGRPGGPARPPPPRARRLGGAGEFQYPNRYVQFPVPLASKRLVSFRVVSADNGNSDYYRLELARGSCPTGVPLFDADVSKCVRFCNQGFFGDFEAKRCKRCQKSCFTCLSPHTCTRCPKATRQEAYMLDNATGLCQPKARSLWEQHPQKTTALALAIVSFGVFLCGLCAFRLHQGDLEERRFGRPPAPAPAAPLGGGGERRAPKIGAPLARGGAGVGRVSGWGSGGASDASYMRISPDVDEFG